MTTWFVDWPALVDQGLLDEIADALAPGEGGPPAAVPALLGRLLAATGGWPYVQRRPRAARIPPLVRRRLGEAFAHALGGVPAERTGYLRGPSVAGEFTVDAVPRVEMNQADAGTIAARLPGVSLALAQRITAERLAGGAFADVDDLVARVDGLGPRRAKRLRSQMGFARGASTAPRARGDWLTDLATLAAQEAGGTAWARVAAALERCAQRVEAEPLPHHVHRRPRALAAPEAPALTALARCGVLAGSRYYHVLQQAIAAAMRRVDVAMFHIAMPGERHPTRALLEALADAHRRGVAVRVLVDRDRRGDPYRSRVINAAAVQFLLAAGVSVRVDEPGRLLHSKFVCIDDDRVLLGSHNWTAGSYFGFDDLSLDLRGAALAAQAEARFAALWARAEDAVAGRGTSPPPA